MEADRRTRQGMSPRAASRIRNPSRTAMSFPSRAMSALAITALLCVGPAVAAWPERPIRFIVSFPAGSSTDIPGRIVAQPLGARLGQTMVIDNVAGSAGAIGARTIARATPDG